MHGDVAVLVMVAMPVIAAPCEWLSPCVGVVYLVNKLEKHRKKKTYLVIPVVPIVLVAQLVVVAV